MNAIRTRVLIGVALIAGAGIVYGCAMPQTGAPVQAVGDGAGTEAVVTAGRFEQDNLALDWRADGGDLAFELDAVVANSCYAAKSVEGALAEDGGAAISAVIGYTPGTCAQANQTLRFEDRVAGGATVQAITLTVLDERTNQTAVHRIEP